ncbi:MAG: hypothetical protein QOJ21_13 [Solirubrobacteraceae bacterium]|jgi:hypothetical protein|nr:hypothetical protein [Solirubrobacteraceae bacterium]
MAPEQSDPLDELRAQIRATREAAERLARDEPVRGPRDRAGDRAAGDDAKPGDAPPRVPPRGWAAPEREGEPSAQDELAALLALLQTLRALVPAELQHQVTEVIRQVLLLVRALIDHLLERLESDRGAPGEREPEVEDIPIA